MNSVTSEEILLYMGKIKRTVFLRSCLLLISLFEFFLVLTEIFLNSKGTSLCTSQSCTLVHAFDVYGILNWIGLLLFGFLFLTSCFDLTGFLTENALNFFLKLRIFTVSSAVLVEGYFIGIQTWYLGKFCRFCLIFAGLLFLFAVFDFIYQRKLNRFSLTYLKAFAGALVIFTATSIVKMPLTSLPETDLPVVVYKKGCPHCRAVMDYAERNGIKFLKVSAENVMPLFHMLHLKGVPVLIHRTETSCEIISGEREIKKWLKAMDFVRKTLLPFSFEPNEGGMCSLNGRECR